jgi:acyl dehydratase
MGVNYGSDKIRLTAPVPAGSRIRAAGRLMDAQEKAGGVLYRVEVTVEVEGSDRPAMIGTILSLVYP